MSTEDEARPSGSEPSAKVVTPEQVLDTPMGPNDAGATTVRGFLIQLLAEVWRKTDAFSGKRPYGNSGWDWDVFAALGRAGHIWCTFDDDGWVEGCDDDEGRRLVADAIEYLGAASGKGGAA